MFKSTRQEFCIKTCPLEDVQGLEHILNSMSKQGWELYSLHEGEINNKVVYNIIFVKEVEFSKDERPKILQKSAYLYIVKVSIKSVQYHARLTWFFKESLYVHVCGVDSIKPQQSLCYRGTLLYQNIFAVTESMQEDNSATPYIHPQHLDHSLDLSEH